MYLWFYVGNHICTFIHILSFIYLIWGHDNEMKYDNLARSLSMMEDELKRADERVKNAEARVVVIEDELAAIGENQKQLEVSEEKARKREEKYQDQIKQLNIRHRSLTGFPKKQKNLGSFFDEVFSLSTLRFFFD